MTEHATTAPPRLSARAILLIELALALGGFAIGTGEFAIMGLMPNVAQDLGISEPQVALSPALQTHLMDVAQDAQTLAAASNHAAFNIANALGPWLGGLAISAGFGWTSTCYIGAATAVAGLLVCFLAWQVQQPGIPTAKAERAANS